MSLTKSTKRGIFILVILVFVTIQFSRELNCNGNPCMYGICLENKSSNYSCYCIDGYTGINCEINWNDCWSDPCLNGGTCNDAVAAYNCTCVDGFAGINCEQKYSECSNQPCLNNGTCVDYDGITCLCPEGYSGDYCEIDASVCNDTICKNGGICEDGPGLSFSCHCLEGWTGKLCEEDINECVQSPCKNGGLCINIPASYTCACLFGYTGKDCDKAVVPCDVNPCKNDAVCLLEDDRPVCYCVPDYHGTLCELKYDDCVSKFANCENGSICVDGINSFTCVCPPFYSGQFCNLQDFPPTTFSNTEEIFETDNAERITAVSSSSTKLSTLPKIDIITPITTATAGSSSSSKDNSGSYTKWYPFTDVTSSTWNESNVNFFNSSESIGKTTQFVTDISIVHPITNKELKQTDTISLETRTLTSVSTDFPLITLTMNNELDYLTQKTIHNYTSKIDGSFDRDDGLESMSIDRTMPSETSSTTEYISDARYHSSENNFIEKVTGEPTLIERGRSSPFSSFTLSTNSMDFGQSKSMEPSTSTMEIPKSSSDLFIDNWTNTPLSKSSSIEMKITTILDNNNIGPYLKSNPSTLEESSTISVEEQSLTRVESELSTESSISSACHGTLCTSSTVMPTSKDSKCKCPEREDCKSGPTVTRAAFNGKSYIRQHVNVQISNGDNATLQIFTRVRTRFKNGIILHVYFDNEKYALVYLEYGLLKFQFSCGFETMLLGEIDLPIDNGYIAQIDTRFHYLTRNESNKCSAYLLVNGTTVVSGEQILSATRALPQYANLHLGGIPMVFSHYFSHISVGFTGCMDTLMVNEIPRHLIYDSTETFQIEDCVSFLCLSNPCQNFGICEEVNGTVYCRCIAGYTGLFCERSICDESPCTLGSTCISSPGTGFMCVCPFGSHGLLCEEDSTVSRPSFSVLVPGFSSYIVYGVASSIKDTMELRLKLIPRTYEQISLIAYLGQSGSRQDLSDHLSITYVRGYIMLTWDLGAGVRRIFTNVPLNAATKVTAASKNYIAYVIQVGRRGRDAWLAVDGIGNVTGRVAGSMTRLDVSPILYIGGHKSSNFETLPHDLPLHTGFSGCIFDVELRTESAIYPITNSSPATGRGVGECHRNECIHHSCKNGAVCLNHGATYSCICTKEWTGFDCSIPVNVLPSSNLPSCHTSNIQK